VTGGSQSGVTAQSYRWVGRAASAGFVRGLARVLREPADLEACRPAEIVVARHATANVAWAARDAAGLVCETGGVLSHMAILARELGIPCVTGLRGIVDAVESGAELRVDGTHGVVDAPAPPRSVPPLRRGMVALLRFGRFSSTFECEQAILSPEAFVRVATLVDVPAAVGLGGPLEIEFEGYHILTAEARLRDLAAGLARLLEAGAPSASALRATYADDCRWTGWDGIPSDVASAIVRFARMNRTSWIAALAKEQVAVELRAFLAERRDGDEPVDERFLRTLAASGSPPADGRLPAHLRRRVDTLADLVWVTERKNTALSRCAAIVGYLPIAEALGLEPDGLADDGTGVGRHRRVEHVRAALRAGGS
jgi:phosphohistidine swiveling domain-containing protein